MSKDTFFRRICLSETQPLMPMVDQGISNPRYADDTGLCESNKNMLLN